MAWKPELKFLVGVVHVISATVRESFRATIHQ